MHPFKKQPNTLRISGVVFSHIVGADLAEATETAIFPF